MTEIKEILKLMDQKTTVYSQKKSLVRELLLAIPGKHEVWVDSKYWGLEFGPEFTTDAYSLSHKAIIKDIRHEKPKSKIKIGLDVDAELTISKKITNLPSPNQNVFVDKLHFPFISYVKKISFQSALIDKPVTIYAANKPQLNLFHDQLVMHGITHTLYPAEEGISLDLKIKYEEKIFNNYAVIFQLTPLEALSCLHNYKAITAFQDANLLYLKEEKLKNIYNLFLQHQNYAINSYFIQRRLNLHAGTIISYLNILEAAGILEIIESNDKCIQITKKELIEGDPFYYAIPQGTFSLSELMTILKIKRHQVFQILKKYEGKLIFTFTPPKCLNYWKLCGELNLNRINEIVNQIKLNVGIVEQLNNDCQGYVNSIVQAYCAQNHTVGFFSSEGITTESQDIKSLVSEL